MDVLIVKLTSMGDLVQALPALTDASRARPGLRFDWVVDEVFAEIPRWHPAIRDVFTTAHRRWRDGFLKALSGNELRAFLRRVRQREYGAVIDAQTNLKSALVTRLTRGKKYGPDHHSVREWGAHLAYSRRFPIAKDQLAIERWRQLFAAALDYPLPHTPADFGLAGKAWPEPNVDLPQEPFLVFVHNASWPNKGWSELFWRRLIERAQWAGYEVVLPWGTAAEAAQAQRLAEGHAGVRVLPRLSLTALAAVFLRSSGAVCVDTGLAHVSAALDVPTVTLYGATDPRLIGATGYNSTHLVADGYPCVPCYRRRCDVPGYSGPEAQCMKRLSPERVWTVLTTLIDGRVAPTQPRGRDSLSNATPRFDRAQVLVVGDLMVDRYWHGGTTRISPEAPVPVVKVEHREDRPGGAANVALNIAALGAGVSLIGVVGRDGAAQALHARLHAVGIHTDFQEAADKPTITKLRVISRHQQLLRLDFEERFGGEDTGELVGKVRGLLGRADVLILSDYAKGVLDDPRELIALARAAGVPVLVDPKGTDFTRYAGATLITPNLHEFEAVVGPWETEQELVRKGVELLERLHLDALLVTRGEQGMTLIRPTAPELHLPARAREVFDVTGAGDTVIAVLAAALAAGEDLPAAVALANLAAGIVVGKLGTATVSGPELRRALHQE
ncbi:MAG: D-glycero-beta-D-manno-heptose-7-phosphate kinase, partial [Porticoccaceae bacterium]